MYWYSKVSKDISKLDDCISFYESEHLAAKKECFIVGNLEKAAADLPGIIENRYSQLQDIEAILEYLNIELKQLRSYHFKKYLEHYARQLSSRDCEKYVEGEADVADFEKIINRFALIRNHFLSLIKSIDMKQWQITNIVKLRCAGLEDVNI
jgi:hypothetical protein